MVYLWLEVEEAAVAVEVARSVGEVVAEVLVEAEVVALAEVAEALVAQVEEVLALLGQGEIEVEEAPVV